MIYFHMLRHKRSRHRLEMWGQTSSRKSTNFAQLSSWRVVSLKTIYVQLDSNKSCKNEIEDYNENIYNRFSEIGSNKIDFFAETTRQR